MKYLVKIISIVSFVAMSSFAQAASFDDLTNYQQNSEKMLSSGLPTAAHFKKLKVFGVGQVIDLIPGDRSEEEKLMAKLGLVYHNIPVQWSNPTLADFEQYVALMKRFESKEGKTLTHCKLNWRGAAFTYLYRVTQLNEDEATAKADMLAIWQPNETWQTFIDKVKARY